PVRCGGRDHERGGIGTWPTRRACPRNSSVRRPGRLRRRRAPRQRSLNEGGAFDALLSWNVETRKKNSAQRQAVPGAVDGGVHRGRRTADREASNAVERLT